MGMSNYLTDKLYDHVLRNTAYTSPATIYLALYTVLPADDGTGGTEVTGGSYARQVHTIGNPALGSPAYNNAIITFTNMPACVVVGACLHDHVSAGNLLFIGRYSSPRSIAAGATVTILIGDTVAVIH